MCTRGRRKCSTRVMRTNAVKTADFDAECRSFDIWWAVQPATEKVWEKNAKTAASNWITIKESPIHSINRWCLCVLQSPRVYRFNTKVFIQCNVDKSSVWELQAPNERWKNNRINSVNTKLNKNRELFLLFWNFK